MLYEKARQFWRMCMSDTDTRIVLVTPEFAVVTKRIGEVCESGCEQSVVDAVKPLIEKKLGMALPFLEAVHRIDRPVSGCVLLACNPDSAANLAQQFAHGTVKKRYDAIVEIRDPARLTSGGRLEHYLLFDRKKQKSIVSPDGKQKNGFKRAVLSWETAGMTDRYACLHVYPETGRTHQIRAQLAAAGMPIKGDLKYGARRSERNGGIRLHASRIQFAHPVTGDVVTVTVPVEAPDALWSAFPGDR